MDSGEATGCNLAVMMRRGLAARLALLFGPDDLRDRVTRLLDGTLGASEAEAMRAYLDRLSRILAGR